MPALAKHRSLARKSFKAIAHETAQMLTRSLAERAQSANRAAKLSFGQLRLLWYAEKARCLRCAIELSPDDFWLDDFEPATGMVGVASVHGVRLHVPLAALEGLNCGHWSGMLAWAKERAVS